MIERAKTIPKKFKEDENIIGDQGSGETLIRKKDKGQWSNTYAPPEVFSINPFPIVFPDPKHIKRARQYPQQQTAWLFIHEYLTMPVGHESGKGYYFPKINLWVNFADGSINNFQLIQPEEEEKVIEESFFKNLEQVQFRPQQIGVNSVMAFSAIREFCEALDIELLFIPEEPLFDEVMQSFKGFMR